MNERTEPVSIHLPRGAFAPDIANASQAMRFMAVGSRILSRMSQQRDNQWARGYSGGGPREGRRAGVREKGCLFFLSVDDEHFTRCLILRNRLVAAKCP